MVVTVRDDFCKMLGKIRDDEIIAYQSYNGLMSDFYLVKEFAKAEDKDLNELTTGILKMLEANEESHLALIRLIGSIQCSEARLKAQQVI